MTRLADALYSWRHTYRLSQANVADLLGVSVRTVNRWERRECHPNQQHCWQIAELLAGAPAGWRRDA